MEFRTGVAIGLMVFNLAVITKIAEIVPDEYKIILLGAVTLLEAIIYFLAVLIGNKLYAEM